MRYYEQVFIVHWPMVDGRHHALGVQQFVQLQILAVYHAQIIDVLLWCIAILAVR